MMCLFLGMPTHHAMPPHWPMTTMDAFAMLMAPKRPEWFVLHHSTTEEGLWRGVVMVVVTVATTE